MPSTSDRRLTGLLAIGFFLGTCGLILGVMDLGKRFSTGILDLLPADESSVEARLLTGTLQSQGANQVILVLRGAGAEIRTEATESLRQRLESSGLVQSPIASADGSIEEVAGFLFANRLELLFPNWLAGRKDQWQQSRPDVAFPEWLADTTVEALDRFLEGPEGFFYTDGLPDDPILILPGLWEELPDWESPDQADRTTLTARLNDSAFDDAVQDRVVPELERIRASIQRDYPEITVLMTGPVFFAKGNRVAIRSEVERLNLLALLGVTGVILLSLRRPLGVLAMAPMVVCGMAGGLVTTVLVFGSVHVIMLVLGAFMAGVTVDYGFHVFLHPGGRMDRTMWKPLGVAAGSTAVGFLALLFGTLPVVRQLGLFVGSGVLSALFAAWCLRPVFPANLTGPRSWLLRQPARSLKPSVLLTILVALLLGATAGLRQVQWSDDIRELAPPLPSLLAEDRRTRDAAGAIQPDHVLVTSGRTWLEAIDNWRGLERAWAATGEAPLIGFGRFLPSSIDLGQTRDFLAEDADGWLRALQRRLKEAGYDPEAFQPFVGAIRHLRIESFSRESIEERLDVLSGTLTGPLAFLMPNADGLRGISSMASARHGTPTVDLEAFPDTVEGNQVAGLNNLFERYRREAWGLVLAGFLVVVIAVMSINGIRTGACILAVPVSAVLLVFGGLGWFQRDLNLFYLLAGLLGFCIALDHALFASHFRSRGDPPPVSVRISALTTVVAFGVLASSRIPAVSALGFTVAAIVTATAIMIELTAASRVKLSPSTDH